MTRFAPAVVGAALVAAGCAPVTANEAMVASDADLFTPCATSVMAANCGGESDDAARAGCLDSRRTAYGRLHSAKMRRSWLIANGCPASTIDTPVKPAAQDVAVGPVPRAVAPVERAAPVAPPPEAPPPTASSPAAELPPPPRQREPAISAPRTAAPVASLDPDGARPAGAFSDRDRAETRTQKLRDIISSHGAEMKICVDRQLKLAPDLQAGGTLVIDVEKDGSVASAALLGADLAGTPLEACLRTTASRWRFPASAHPYTISSPVKVLGSAHGAPR